MNFCDMESDAIERSVVLYLVGAFLWTLLAAWLLRIKLPPMK